MKQDTNNLTSNTPSLSGDLNKAPITGSNETTASNDLKELVSGLMAEKRGQEGISGYNHWKVKETMRNSALFEAWFEALPEDLTDCDLSPLYDIAGDYDQTRRLSVRARQWYPDANNLSQSYNGPIGEDGKPDPYLVTRWQTAVNKAQAERLSRFRLDIVRMQGFDLPARLRDAAMNLAELALEAGIQRDGDEPTEFDSSSSSDEVIAVASAIRLCFAALCELDELARERAETVLSTLRDMACDIEAVGGVA